MTAPAAETRPALRVLTPDVAAWRRSHRSAATEPRYEAAERGGGVVVVDCPDSPSARIVLRLPVLPAATLHDVLCALRDAHGEGQESGFNEGYDEGFDDGWESGSGYQKRKYNAALKKVGLGMSKKGRVEVRVAKKA